MKKYLFIIYIVFSCFSSWGQTAVIPDANFLNYLKSTFPAIINSSDELIIAEAANITATINCSNLNISSIEGIQYFINVKSINAYDNQLTSLPDLTNLTQLDNFQVQRNQITALPPLSHLSKLRLLFIYENQLTSIPDLSGCVLLEELIAQKNQLVSIGSWTGLSLLHKVYLFDNQLTSIPEVSTLVNLQNLQLQRNQLTSLPDMSNLTALHKFYAYNNQIYQLPDLSNCINLTDIDVNDNEIVDLPDLNSLVLLNRLEVTDNRLSFEDYEKIYTHPNFSSQFYFNPQKLAKNKDTILYQGASITLSHNIDMNVPNTIYQWTKNGTPITGATQNTYLFNPISVNDAGTYACLVTNSNYPGITISAFRSVITVLDCPSAADISVIVTHSITCENNGAMEVSVNNVYTNQIDYILTSSITGKNTMNQHGHFQNLNETTYKLSIQLGSACVIQYPQTVVLEKSICNETYFTPDGDQDRDEIVFETTGSIVIYDKSGKLINTITTPGSWDGKDSKGNLVPLGLYIVKTDQNKIVYISVIY